MWTAKRQMEADKLKADQFALSQEEFKHKQAQDKAAAAAAAAKRDRSTYVDPATGDTATVAIGDITKLVPYDQYIAVQKALEGKKPESYFNKPTAKQQKEFEALASQTNNMSDLIKGFKAKYEGSGLPLTGSVANLIAREAPVLAGEDMEEKQHWWSEYKRLYELTTRHELFGSALTKGEQEQWRQANINPNMSAKQIKHKLAIQDRLQRKLALKAAENAKIKGWSPEYIHANYGDVVSANAAQEEAGGAELPVAVPEKVPESLSADISQADWASLSQEERLFAMENPGDF
jgi:hypothetical protein